MITGFSNITDKDNPLYGKVEKFLDAIRKGHQVDTIIRLRATTDKKEKAELKKKLFCICFSGKFKKRTDGDIIKHSGLTVLDFDHVGEKFKDVIIKDSYTYAAFISPSGDGVKVLFRIPPEIENHESYYLGIIDYCKEKGYPDLDTTSKNISRVCFVSYDPDLYVNEDSEVFTRKVVEKNTPLAPISSAPKTDYKKMDIPCEMIRKSTDGNKHHELLRASRLTGGFIAGGLVEESEGIRILELEINKKDVDDFKQAQKTIRDGIDHGKNSPITDDNYRTELKRIQEEDIILKDEPAKDVIFLDDVRDKIERTYEHGTSRGESTYYPEIDAVYRMKRGEVTLLHGIGNHGKSVFLRGLLMAKSYYDKYKWGIFSPEDMPEEEFYKDLIHSYIGKSTEKHHHNQMTRQELREGMDFIREHFFLIYPKDTAPTPRYMNNRFRELIIKKNIDGCVIDPYNQLDNDISKTGGREDQYISRFLTEAKRFAVDHNQFYFIVAHPKGSLTKDGRDYECPNVYDLSGGAMWNNKCDNIMVVHRPRYTSDRLDTGVLFSSQKIKKQKLNGIPGDVDMFFDRMTNRFNQVSDSYNPLQKEPFQKEEMFKINEDVPF